MAERWQQWMPFHIDRFRGSPDVQAMHPSARAGFLYLLCSAWQTGDCSLSRDPLDLAVASGLGDELWGIHGPRILRKFTVADGRLRNEVLEKEWADAKRIFESRQEAARKTTQTRSPHGHRTPTDSVTDATPLRSADTITETLTRTSLPPNPPRGASRKKNNFKFAEPGIYTGPSTMTDAEAEATRERIMGGQR